MLIHSMSPVHLTQDPPNGSNFFSTVYPWWWNWNQSPAVHLHPTPFFFTGKTPQNLPSWPAIVVSQAGKVLQQFGVDDVGDSRSQGTCNTKPCLIIFLKNPRAMPYPWAGRGWQMGHYNEQSHTAREADSQDPEQPLQRENILSCASACSSNTHKKCLWWGHEDRKNRLQWDVRTENSCDTRNKT